MAGHANFTALLDANTLYPILTCDALMSLAAAGLFAPKWSQRIETEWMRNLEAERPELSGKLALRRDQMRRAAPDWEVAESAIGALLPGITLPDPGDAHVLAAAIAGHADCIVTFNLKDFPEAALAPLGIEAIHPDRFIISQLDLAPFQAIAALGKMRQRRKSPPYSPEDFACAFERNGLPAVASRLREAAGLI
ncbi:MAG: PIN domain-containing protein [Rhodocyclaceae bacterium]